MILVCQGTRPEQLKLNPIVRLARQRGLPIHLHCTNQSPDLLDPTMEKWDSIGQTNILELPVKPSLIVVQGDTRTAFGMALAGFEAGVPVHHIEAGVRTYDIASPCPEEGYRRMISAIATYHACTTETNRGHLQDEWGFEVVDRADPYLRVTGSPIVESVRERLKPADIVLRTQSPEVILTLHRRENRGHFADILRGVCEAVPEDIRIVWATHPNSWAFQECPEELKPRMQIAMPIPPRSFASALAGADCAITDSGGVQEESCCVGTPCVVARTITDRPESLGKGGAILAGNTRDGVAKAIREALAMDRTQIDRTIFGDGTASQQIVDWWEEILR